ncbi:MAG TPA: proton-conducting membrane transporter [Clostridiales bacterium]|nr:MAG: NADH dehydrogenase [Clostridiales bacterium GWD2_32_19]HCC07602.1 proton-conducting membrane transporter [Clostridiales bacterium]
MKINLLEKEIKNINNRAETEIKNNNELYINTTFEEVKNIVGILMNNLRLVFVGEFCIQEKSFIINIILTNRRQGYFVTVRYNVTDELVSLQDFVPQSNLFEREISDLYGIKIVDGKDTRNIVKHEIWQENVFPLRKDYAFGSKVKLASEVSRYKFMRISGEGGYQIPVGPVHAGIIEPGHFRFSATGEPIENLEIRLMYKHKGIEKICENINANNLNLLFERVAGESSVAYAECYALLVEKLIEWKSTDEVKAVRVVLLELERIYNYLDDITGICVDIGYSYPPKKFSYLSEMIHQLCERLTGSRFLRNAIVPCGINIDFNEVQKADILYTLKNIEKRLNNIIESTLGSVSFLDRVEHTGVVYNKTANKIALTGVVGRSAGIEYDVRRNFPYEIYKEIKTKTNTETAGGVFERYKLKIAEIKDAFIFIRKALSLIEGDVVKNKPEIILQDGLEAYATVETVKGELVVYGKTGENNTFDRIYFKTPSFTNWNGLTYAVAGEIVPDFPLCNKSFNMSYAENDR